MDDKTLSYKEDLARQLDASIRALEDAAWPIQTTIISARAAEPEFFPGPDRVVTDAIGELKRSRDRLRREVEAEYAIRRKREQRELEAGAALDLAANLPNPYQHPYPSPDTAFAQVREVVRRHRKAFE